MNRVRAAKRRGWIQVLATLSLVVGAMALPPIEKVASAQFDGIKISEVVAANNDFVDSFGQTSDWFEIRNDGVTQNLLGWTVIDGDGNSWSFPSLNIAAGSHVLVRASQRDLYGSELHSNFALKREGEELRLVSPAAVLIDVFEYPELGDGQAWGRAPNGDLGYLVSPTPRSPNTGLLPSKVTIETEGTAFVNQMEVTLSGIVAAGESIRYTTDGTPVGLSSPQYSGPIQISSSTVVRAAIVGNGLVGIEELAGYTALASDLTTFSSTLPLVILHSSTTVSETESDAIFTLIEPDGNGIARVLDTPAHTGFAGFRIRGATSSTFAKKQYKLETWGDRLGDEVPVDLLGTGADGDWGLYAPGRFDRAMINNPLLYELANRVGIESPDYKFVELFIESNETATVGIGDYRGLYVIRETVEIDQHRLDITKHTSTSAGPAGGYIIRYDWADTCCRNIGHHPQFGSKIAVDSPGVTDLTASQFTWIKNWWTDLQAAAKVGFDEVDPFIDFDNFIDGWLLSILVFDIDILRASHYMHLDAGGQLRYGPVWDADRAMGSADNRADSLVEAVGWTHPTDTGHSYESDIYADLWTMPEVQARLRSRWASLRQGAFSDAEVSMLVDELGARIAEAYPRENATWNDGAVTYGSRYGGLAGELNHMKSYLSTRANWLDGQFLSGANPPQIQVDGPLVFAENQAVTLDVTTTATQEVFLEATGLPKGLTFDEDAGTISGVVGFGDGGTFDVTVTATTSAGATATKPLEISVLSPLLTAPAVLLNEFNAVESGRSLGFGGSDTLFGQVPGNGGDWFEIVTLEDHLDMRSWKFDIWSKNALGDLYQSARLVLEDDPLLSDIRAGSIITVAESLPDSLSYDPQNDDWTLNLQANTAGDGAMFASQLDFDTNERGWRLVVRDSTDKVRATVAGETANWDMANLAVGNDEVFALKADPSIFADPVADWSDDTASTFGAPNFVGARLQRFDTLRPFVPPLGDVSCDGISGVVDALMIAQFSVGNRFAEFDCPLLNPVQGLHTPSADVNGDSSINVVDSLIITQCSVGIINDYCD